MGGIDIQQTKETGSKDSLAESNFDKLQKAYPNEKDKLNFLNDTKFSDIKEQLSKTISELAKDETISQEYFWKNIQKTIEDAFNDPTFDMVFELKEQQANNIYLYREAFKNKKIQEATDINEDKTDINEDKTDINEDKTKANIEEIKILRGELKQGYTNIDAKYKPTIDQRETFKKENIKIKSILEDKNFKDLDQDKQNLYISYRYAGEQIAKEATENKTITQANYDFITKFNQLDKELEIESPIEIGEDIKIIEEEETPDKNPDDITEHSIKDIVYNKNLGADLVKNNADVEDFVLDTETDTLDDKEITDNTDIKEKIEDNLGTWYKEEIQSGISTLLKKNKLDAYTENFDESGKLINTDKIPDKDKQKLQKISDKIIDTYTAQAQEKILKDTNEVIKSKAVGALLQNIGQYFKIDNFAKEFTIDLKSGISFDEKQLQLSGSMEGKNISFYYDMNTGEVSADDFVHYNKEDETFYIDRGNKDSKGREKLPLKMPTLKNTLKDSESVYSKAIPDTLKNADTPDEYKTQLNDIPFSVHQESPVADTIIEHTMAKNIAIQETQDFLKDYIPTKNAYSKDKEMREYSLYTMIDTSFDRYTTNEIKQRRNLLERFTSKMSEKNPTFKDEMIQGIFGENTVEKDTNGKYDTSKGPSMYNFLRGLTYEQPGTIKNEVMDILFFEQIVTELESNDGDTKKLKDKSPKYKALRTDRESTQEQLSADTIDFDKAYENPTA
ncbi:MAG: hypothetical protein NT085_02220 [candidate division SR1 bacterium]|nr:hypothetical protein [candidate division SR1 bacterium]